MVNKAHLAQLNELLNILRKNDRKRKRLWWEKEGFQVGKYDDEKIYLRNNRTFSVAGSYKFEEDLGSKEVV